MKTYIRLPESISEINSNKTNINLAFQSYRQNNSANDFNNTNKIKNYDIKTDLITPMIFKRLLKQSLGTFSKRVVYRGQHQLATFVSEQKT